MATTQLASRQVPAGSTLISGSATATFLQGYDAKKVTISNANVVSTSKILLSITVPSSRDFDEMEMVSFQLSYGNIIDNTSFDVVVNDLSGQAEGDYTINYLII